jgi:hypothetical protein
VPVQLLTRRRCPLSPRATPAATTTVAVSGWCSEDRGRQADAACSQANDRTERAMGYGQESFESRRQRLGIVVHELAADLVAERRRRLVLEREVRELRTRLAAYETSDLSARIEHQASSQR